MSKIYFLSDAHLGAWTMEREKEKEDRLFSFLERVKREGEALYILGDLFDFFFEYRTVIPFRHVRVIEGLADLVRSGVKVTYIVGNHDYWIGSFFQKVVGVTLSRKPLEVTLEGKRLFLTHGDSLGNSSLGDRLLKMILRSPLTIFLFSWIHPDIGSVIARWVSGRSREKADSQFRIREEMEKKVGEIHDFARKKYDEGFDGVVCGHIHLPKIFEESGKFLLILGDWFQHFSFGILEDGALRLEIWKS